MTPFQPRRTCVPKCCQPRFSKIKDSEMKNLTHCEARINRHEERHSPARTSNIIPLLRNKKHWGKAAAITPITQSPARNAADANHEEAHPGKDACHAAYEDVYVPGVIVAVNTFKAQDLVPTADQAAADDVDWTSWDVNNAAEKDVVLALLGTDNGKGSGYILVDYNGILQGKMIIAIHTRRQEGNWGMVTEYS
ncbi:hypothetical protein B0H17DRAFT_1149400 [Mycena rosella]|uniref:Uncharacterized protein n=1 Tax=Mycena rosella TaxID=1033263 RepID=A0AAD7C2Y3_MYCRO|nr:hypothetical protein B0H17DRAFT_1149400 [Mycena rosella]